MHFSGPYVLPPYGIPPSITQKKPLDDMEAFFGGTISNLETIIDNTKYQLPKEASAEHILSIIQQQYSDMILLPSAYCIGYRSHTPHEYILLQSETYGTIALPGGKGDGAIIIELLEKRRDAVKHHFGAYDIPTILRTLQKQRTPHLRAKLIHLFSSFDMRDDHLVNRFDAKVMDILGRQEPNVQQLLSEKMGYMPRSLWLKNLLLYTPESIEEILAREYTEETGRHIEDKQLLFVQLEKKGERVLKVRFYYTGTVSKKDISRIDHTEKEKDGGIIEYKENLPKAIERSKHMVEAKLGFRRFDGTLKLKTKKTSTALGHYIALQFFALLQNK